MYFYKKAILLFLEAKMNTELDDSQSGLNASEVSRKKNYHSKHIISLTFCLILVGYLQ